MHIFTKMPKEKKKTSGIQKIIELDSGIHTKVDKNTIVIEKGNIKIERNVNLLISASVEDNKIILKTKKDGRVEKRVLGSLVAHLKNAVEGFKEPFKYKLQIANVHFPMTVSHDKNTNEIVIKNFLGEKKDRRAKILDTVNVKINKDIIEVDGPDIEKAGQTAANIEKGTKVRFRDRRIFQDGIFIIEKPGRVFL